MTRWADATEGDVVWGTDSKSRQWTSGGLRGTFFGKDHAYVIRQVREIRGAVVLYGEAICGTGGSYTRLESASDQPGTRCRRCERSAPT